MGTGIMYGLIRKLVLKALQSFLYLTVVSVFAFTSPSTSTRNATILVGFALNPMNPKPYKP